MKVAVKDANVLIDLMEADLLGLWFRIGIETHTTDLVIHEIKRPDQSRMVSTMVQAGNLKVHAFDAKGLIAVSTRAVLLRVSLADASAISLAEEKGAILLSGDRRVRNGATELGLEVKGLLWVFDELVKQSLLVPADAANRLKIVLAAGARLPDNECEERLRRWLPR